MEYRPTDRSRGQVLELKDMSSFTNTADSVLDRLRKHGSTKSFTKPFILILIILTIASYACGPKNSAEKEISADPENTSSKLAKKGTRDNTQSGEENTDSEGSQIVTYEDSPILKASNILDQDILKSEYHEVQEEVQGDCVWNSYKIESEFGDFNAYNTNILKVRVNEIQAIAKLQKTSGAEAMTSGAVASVINPFTSAINIATNPVGTAVGIPGGVVTFFKKIYYTGEKTVKITTQTVQQAGGVITGSEDQNGDAYSGITGDVGYLLDWYLGVSGGERRVAKKLGVDPYTSNPVLAAELKRVAKYERVGRLGFGYVNIPSVPGMRYVKDVNHYIWDKDPRELRDYNKNSLLKMGVDEELVETFLNSPYYSPSFQTAIVFSLQEMDGVSNREEIIEDAVVAWTIPQAQFFTNTVLLLTWFHINQSPFKNIINHSDITSGLTADNRIITILPVDYVCWSEQVAEAANFHNDVLSDIKAEQKEFWFAGSVSDRTKSELNDLGWIVYDNVEVESLDAKHDEKGKAAQEINTEVYKAFEKEEVEGQEQE
jgi:hypothetical protein